MPFPYAFPFAFEITEQEIIDDLFNTYWSEIDTTTYVDGTNTVPPIAFPRLLFDEALDQLAALFEKEWYIDFNKKLHYFTPSIVGAPFELSSSPAPMSPFPYTFPFEFDIAKVGYDKIFFEEDASQLCNRVTVIGNFLDSGDTIQDVGGIDAVQTTIDVTAGGNFLIGQTIRIDSERCQITNIVGNTLTVIRGVDGTDAIVHDNGIIIFIRVETIREDATSYAFYERYFECKVIDENINTNVWADSVGDAVLAERAFGKEVGNLVCYQEGLVVGQKVKIYNFLRGIDAYYLIQGIKFNMLNSTTEKITVRFGDYNKDLIALLGQIKGLEEKE